MARRCSREQVSQKVRDLPFSTAVVQVRVDSPSRGLRPQKEQVGTCPPYKTMVEILHGACRNGDEPGDTV